MREKGGGERERGGGERGGERGKGREVEREGKEERGGRDREGKTEGDRGGGGGKRERGRGRTLNLRAAMHDLVNLFLCTKASISMERGLVCTLCLSIFLVMRFCTLTCFFCFYFDQNIQLLGNIINI